MYLNNNNLCIHQKITESKLYIKKTIEDNNFISVLTLKVNDDIDIYLGQFKAFRKYKTYDVYVVYRETGLIIGIAGLEKNKDYPYPNITSIGIDRKWTGKGIGTEIYKTIINRFGGICSDFSLTAASIKVWKKLQKEYTIEAAKFTYLEDEYKLKYINFSKIRSLISPKFSDIFLIARKA